MGNQKPWPASQKARICLWNYLRWFVFTATAHRLLAPIVPESSFRAYRKFASKFSRKLPFFINLTHCRALSTSLTIGNESSDSPSTISSGLFSVDTQSFFWHIHTRKKQLLIYLKSEQQKVNQNSKNQTFHWHLPNCGKFTRLNKGNYAIVWYFNQPFDHLACPSWINQRNTERHCSIPAKDRDLCAVECINLLAAPTNKSRALFIC